MRTEAFRGLRRVIPCLLFILPLVTGCWDRLEIEQRATVLGLAIDTESAVAEEAPRDVGKSPSIDATTSSGMDVPYGGTLFRLTAQIAVPGRIPLGPGEGGGGGGGSRPQEAVWVLHSAGTTVNDALQQLQQQVADKLFLGHLRILVVSEAFARARGMQVLTDFLVRHPEVRRTVWVVVSRGRAADLMQTAPPLERVPTLYLMSTLDHAKQMGKLSNDFFGMFASKVVAPGRDPVLPYVEVMQRDNINLTGLAFFQGDQMVGTTARPFDISTYMLLTGVRPGGYTMMVQVPGQADTVMWQAYRRKQRVDVTFANGRPHLSVQLHIDGNVTEKSSDRVNLDDAAVIRRIDEAVAAKTRANIEAVLERTRELGTDPVGFGEYVRAKHRRYWDRAVKSKDRWRDLYPDIPVDVRVTVTTHRLGMKGR
ncbi:Ger(x)C family spore germination protein [Alicyclobacillus sp.]|uniref:Ger(x)C family spore germination protein n=1 Tax=Alicyclobacillus sp. TaxID=61169 RepID=UPI0025C51256|nr:Ger(x)C family spore germination protein [Alicyclobacillus sp.]MCL6516428.1 Ger(x)C family spore germination protein [Alicyclobacillus sp.]